MSVIQEEEAKDYPDLYVFENNCIDFLRNMQRLRDSDPEWTKESVVEPAKEMQDFLRKALIEAQNHA